LRPPPLPAVFLLAALAVAGGQPPAYEIRIQKASGEAGS